MRIILLKIHILTSYRSYQSCPETLNYSKIHENLRKFTKNNLKKMGICIWTYIFQFQHELLSVFHFEFKF